MRRVRLFYNLPAAIALMSEAMTSSRGSARALAGTSLKEYPRWPRLWPVLSAVLLGLLFLAVYLPTIQRLIDHWSSNDMYSYGFLVPAICAYLIWLRRERLQHVAIKPSFAAGIPVLVGGLVLLIIGRVTAMNLVEELSLPITICGLVTLVLGGQMAKSLAFPLAYLFTMIPFWDVFTGRLHLPFQLYSAAMGVAALRSLNIPVLHQGVLIELPNVTLEVAELCSGVNNLVAIMCIGVPLTHFYVKGWPKRLGIMIVAALIALVSNGVRVATVCLFAFYGIRGADGDIHGPFSLMRSLAISGVGFLALFWLIRRFAEPDAIVGAEVSEEPKVERGWRSGVAIALAVALMIFADGFERWRPVQPVPLREGLVGFPSSIGPWESHVNQLLDNHFGIWDFDSKLLRDYQGPDGSEASVLLGYLDHQTQGRELAGSGLVDQLGARRAARRGVAAGTVMDGVVSSARGRLYVVYAYVVDGEVLASDYQVKWRTLRNVVSERRSNGGFVVVAAKIGAGDTVDAVRARYRDLVDRVLPLAAALMGGRIDSFREVLTPP
jgi:EpsI family protein